ncbi:MAG TPA: peroxiredoxin [Polyangiaceae bacterium]|nr:peroxiredoxin [Polyangiaceae bacterium]
MKAAQPSEVASSPSATTASASSEPRAADDASAGSSSVELTGEALPAFSLWDHSGTPRDNATYAGAPWVLYFYPKDDTPGCTKEACGFNDELAAFSELGLQIVGVSPDNAQRHTFFRAKYGLTFTLLSDPDHELAKALGVYKLKSNYGRQYMGIERSTFLIDGAGVIRKVWRAVRVAGHVPQVLEAARALTHGS